MTRSPAPPTGLFPPREKTAETIDKEHGRLEHRKIQLFDPDLAAYVKDDLAFPHVLQTFKITRTIRHMKTGRVATEVAYGLTSHSEESASPADLLKKVRSHWSIENSLHWVKDVVLGEDRSTVHVGNGPRNMATFRNLAIALGSSASRKSGFASLLRQFAWNRETVLDFLRV
jgi:predicted transposase YbfD/YdcC